MVDGKSGLANKEIPIRYFWSVFGRYFSVFPNRYRRKTWSVLFGIINWREPLFHLKICTYDTIHQTYKRESRESKVSTPGNTDQNTNRPVPVYGIPIPIPKKLPVSKRYTTLGRTYVSCTSSIDGPQPRRW